MSASTFFSYINFREARRGVERGSSEPPPTGPPGLASFSCCARREKKIFCCKIKSGKMEHEIKIDRGEREREREWAELNRWAVGGG